MSKGFDPIDCHLFQQCLNSYYIHLTSLACDDVKKYQNTQHPNIENYCTTNNPNAAATITSNGTGDLTLNTNSGTDSSAIKIVDAANVI